MTDIDLDQHYDFVKHEYQVNLQNGDIDFITVYDLPEQVALKFVKNKYPDCEISLFRSTAKLPTA